MSTMVCDICGGKLKILSEKVALCESCGLEHYFEQVCKTKKEEITTVFINDKNLLNNYFKMAKDAYECENNTEAEEYCNKIIEIDYSDANVFLLKGKAIGWQSSIDELRFKEMAVCFANAVNCCTTENQKQNMCVVIREEFKNLATALIQLRCERFQRWPDGDEYCGFKADLNEISYAVDIYIDKTNEAFNKNYIWRSVASIVLSCINTSYENIFFKYKTQKSKNAYSKFITETDYCIDIMKMTIDLIDDDDESDVLLYEKIVQMLNILINMNTVDTVQNRWGAYIDIPRLSPLELTKKKTLINECEKKIQKIKQHL